MKKHMIVALVLMLSIASLSFIPFEHGNIFFNSNNREDNWPVAIDEHSFTPGYLIPTIEPSKVLLEACAKRRAELLEKMEGDVAIFGSAEDLGRKVGNSYEYRQSSNLYYLTGFTEPNTVCLFISGSETPFIMFVTPFFPWQAARTGDLFGPEGAEKVFGADKAYSIFEIDKILPELLTGKNILCMEMRDVATKKMVNGVLDKMKLKKDPKMIDIAPMVHEMRVIKDEYEVSILRKAINITANSHREAMKAARPGIYEYEVEAIIEYNYRKSGAYRPGFASIVASGRNSTILHYSDSEKKMEDGEVLLMDLGGEFKMYTADITRTIPVNGKFSKEQKELYEIVLNAQKAAINLLKPGIGINESYEAALKVFANGLYDLGLITDIDSEWQVSFYTVHGISHYIGLVVHDVGSYRRETEKGRLMEPGMILTVEPGLYMREDRLDYIHEYLGNRVSKEEIDVFLKKVTPVYEKYKNIGIRIEDDVLITRGGNEIVSINAPREVEDIEKLMSEKNSFISE